MGTFLTKHHWSYRSLDISELIGKTVVQIDGAKVGSEEIRFVCSDGSEYLMYHWQDCCESVQVEEIIGNISSLIGSPISMAEEASEKGEENDWGTSTWTFYKFATLNGYVTIRWLGESNGYYSEDASILCIKEKNNANE